MTITLPQPSIILGAGAAGVGKTTVIKDVLPHFRSLFYLEKDVCLEAYLHSNPFYYPESDERLSFHSDFYKNHLRTQVYSAMFQIALSNAALRKSSLLDANYVAWLQDPHGEFSFARKISCLFSELGVDSSTLRLPILYFHVTDPLVVKKRIEKRMALDPAARDRDSSKVATNDAWTELCTREPPTLYPALTEYADICFVDLTEEYAGINRQKIRSQIRDYLDQEQTLRTAGIFKNESLEETMARFAPK